MEGRYCTKCEIWKEWEKFAINKKGLNNRKSVCKDCSNKNQRQLTKRRNKENPEKWRQKRWEQSIKKKYGLSPEDYFELLEQQNGGCKICGKTPEESRDGRLCVDHCHVSLKNRGLLCYRCNTVLGMANDDVTILKKAIEYLNED